MPIETAPAPIDATVAPPAPEQNERREISQDTQRREISLVARSTLYRRSNAAETARNGKSDAEIQQVLNVDKGMKAIDSIRLFAHLKEGSYRQPNQTDSLSFGIPLIAGEPLIVDSNGEQIQVLYIQEGSATAFKCYVEIHGGGREQRVIARQDIINAQLISEQDAILTSVSPQERAVLGLYIQTMGRKDPLEGADPETVNKAIQEAAKAGAILTSEDLASLVHRMLPEQKAADGASLTQEQIAQNTTRTELLLLLGEKNVMDIETTTQVLEKTGCTTTKVNQVVESVTQQLSELKTQLAKDPNNAELKQKITQAQGELRLLQKASAALSEGKFLEDYFNSVEQGEVNPQTAKPLVDAIKSGDPEKLLDAAFPNNPDATPEEIAENKNEKEAMKKYLKNGALGTGIIALLLMVAAGEIAKPITGAR